VIKQAFYGGILLLMAWTAPLNAADTTPTDEQRALGKAIASDRNKGNCLSCHMMDGAELPGNSGPPLLMMQARFPDRAVLRAQIVDARERNPNTSMPPYGRHRILTDEEIDRVVDYIHAL